MGDPRGFLNLKRKSCEYRQVDLRTKDFREVFTDREEACSKEQASRCMDCGTPFCIWACPAGNVIPEWNDLAFNGKWERAFELLDSTNVLPEVTGRVCPAMCEFACVLGINDDPVTIRENELAIIEHAFKSGSIKARPPKKKTGKKVAIVGSGPAGISAAAFLNRYGHSVTVFEKDEKIGGIMRYGIPDFKLDKKIIDRRINLLKEEGVKFITKTDVGLEYPMSKLNKEFDAVCIATGSRVPRDLKIPGRELKGIHFALDYLIQSNKRVAGWQGDGVAGEQIIDAKGKDVVVIGGGDTGSDCVGTARRQGAKNITQIEILDKPQTERPVSQPWPAYPSVLKTSSSHEEGCERHWAISSKSFDGKNGRLEKIKCLKVRFSCVDGKPPVMEEIPGSEFEIRADMAFLALGFLHTDHSIISGTQIETDSRGNIKTSPDYMTKVKGVFSAGDARKGQSLIVWAIDEGRKAAEAIDRYLT